MKTLPTILLILLIPLLASCGGWFIQPLPYNPPTPFLPPTNTPSIYTATPVVIGVPTLTPQIATSTNFSFPTNTVTSTVVSIPFDTPSATSTNAPTGLSISVEVLGCDTSIDVTHGMGEVTNAFVVLRNTGGVELTNLKVTLNARDEGRVHPDKTVEIPVLPVGYKITLKLTVDSTYRAETPIQVEVTADNGLFQRVGAESCKDIGLFAPNPDALNTPVPNNP